MLFLSKVFSLFVSTILYFTAKPYSIFLLFAEPLVTSVKEIYSQSTGNELIRIISFSDSGGSSVYAAWFAKATGVK